MQKETICQKCRQKAEVNLKYNLLGFRKFECSKCKYKNVLPLGKIYKVIYVFLGICGIIAIISYFSKGTLDTWSILLTSLCGIALYKDFSLRKTLQVK